jgi:hypothetical protein
VENKIQKKIYIGMIIIILSPLLGSLLFQLYIEIVGSMISTNGAADMFWFSCILVIAILGMATVLIGCNEKAIKQKNEISE